MSSQIWQSFLLENTMKKSTSQSKNPGLIYIFTGDGKGKTSAALGMLTRALANNWKVSWISWYKEASWGVSEHALSTILNEKTQKNLTFLPMGKGFYLKNEKTDPKSQLKIVKANSAIILDNDSVEEHKQAAQQALQKAEELLPQVQILFLDEICNAVDDGLLEVEAVLELLRERSSTHIVLTGRNVHPKLKESADLVSEIKKIKHPFDNGKLAVKGLDF